MNRIFTTFVFLLLVNTSFAADGYWQQRVEYKMHITMKSDLHQFSGKQELKYYNNSPDELNKIYYHLYFNAFQPGSEMDIRSQKLPDPDKRVGDRIAHLKENEIGYHRISSLKQNGKDLTFEVQGTILEVTLATPLKPGKSAVFTMEFESQVPLQVRRSGRDNEEGIEFSMTQWYPKLCEYDKHGWHTDPYIGREFHGVWGDFEVNITMDSAYTIGGTGYLQNAEEIGKGYLPEGKKANRKAGDKLTWRFKAENVHDFAWAADPDYTHITHPGPDGLTLHMFYQSDSVTSKTWPQLGEYMAKAFQVLNENFGKYPHKQYTFIQGGDGGMEYPMTTLITGHRPLSSLVGVSVHEAIHSWYQGELAFDESRYYWMDEGFTQFASDFVMSELFEGYGSKAYRGLYSSYYSIAGSGQEQPLTTHADWFETNKAYGIGAYSKGGVFLCQLRFMLGDSIFMKGMQDFYTAWQGKHPEAGDFKQIMEKVSDWELEWYFEQWISTTNTIDYSVQSLVQKDDLIKVRLKREGLMPVPLEVMLQFSDGSSVLISIPLDVARNEKSDWSDPFYQRFSQIVSLHDWRWVDDFYGFSINTGGKSIAAVIIDPQGWLADVDKDNDQVIVD